MTNQPLSPAAQAVYNAVLEICPAPADEIAAAALRAAADQVVPRDADEPRNYLPMAIECQRKLQRLRAELLAIAAELEDQ